MRRLAATSLTDWRVEPGDELAIDSECDVRARHALVVKQAPAAAAVLATPLVGDDAKHRVEQEALTRRVRVAVLHAVRDGCKDKIRC